MLTNNYLLDYSDNYLILDTIFFSIVMQNFNSPVVKLVYTHNIESWHEVLFSGKKSFCSWSDPE